MYVSPVCSLPATVITGSLLNLGGQLQDAAGRVTPKCSKLPEHFKQWDTSPGILSSKVGQPATNCKRIFLNGFLPRNMSSVTYQKSPKIRAGDVDKKQVFLEPYTAQHGNEAVCTVCCVARV